MKTRQEPGALAPFLPATVMLLFRLLDTNSLLRMLSMTLKVRVVTQIRSVIVSHVGDFSLHLGELHRLVILDAVQLLETSVERGRVPGLAGAALQILGDHVLVEIHHHYHHHHHHHHHHLVEIHLRQLVERVHVVLEELQLLLLDCRVVSRSLSSKSINLFGLLDRYNVFPYISTEI